MRNLKLFLLSLILVGCGNSSNNEYVITPGVVPGPPQGLLTINANNGLQITNTINELTVPSGRHSLEIAGGDLSLIEIDGVAAALVELPLAYPVLDDAPSGSFAGPGGGTAELLVNGADVSISFSDFVTEDGTRLNGSAFLSGEVDGHNGNVSVTFTAFEIADADGDYQIDGPVTLFIERTDTVQGHEEIIRRTLSVTVTDRANGGTVEFIDINSNSDIVDENGFQNGLSDNTGSFDFRNYQGLNGLAERYPIEPFSFVVNESTLVSTVTGGEAWLVGNGVLRRRVIADNVYEVSVRPAGSSEFQVLGTTDISDIDEE
jgi:hypothetical protein